MLFHVMLLFDDEPIDNPLPFNVRLLLVILFCDDELSEIPNIELLKILLSNTEILVEFTIWIPPSVLFISRFFTVMLEQFANINCPIDIPSKLIPLKFL